MALMISNATVNSRVSVISTATKPKRMKKQTSNSSSKIFYIVSENRSPEAAYHVEIFEFLVLINHLILSKAAQTKRDRIQQFEARHQIMMQHATPP